MRAGTVGIAVGSIWISTIVHGLEQPDLESAFLPFIGIASEVDCLPLGSECMLWNPDALAIQDQQLAEYEAEIRERALADCRTAESALIADLNESDESPSIHS
jgi:hypothetical protein